MEGVAWDNLTDLEKAQLKQFYPNIEEELEDETKEQRKTT